MKKYTVIFATTDVNTGLYNDLMIKEVEAEEKGFAIDIIREQYAVAGWHWMVLADSEMKAKETIRKPIRSGVAVCYEVTGREYWAVNVAQDFINEAPENSPARTIRADEISASLLAHHIPFTFESNGRLHPQM